MRKQRIVVALAILGLCIVGLAQTTPQTQPADQKATIQGTVMRAGTGQALKRARVTLRRSDQQQRQPAAATGFAAGAMLQQLQVALGGTNTTAVTDDAGRFAFNGVEPGQYRISVDRDGYVRQEYGQRSYSGPGMIISVVAGQHLTNIDFQMAPSGAITGRIFNEDGEPLAAVQVQAQTYTYVQGKRTLSPSGQSTQTNDLGEYRLYWLSPADYYISAVARRGVIGVNPVVTQQAAGQRGDGQRGGRGGQPGSGQVPSTVNEGSVSQQSENTYAPTYFPGTISPESASPVAVQPAAEIRGIDFALRPTPTVKITGRVLVPVSTAQGTTPAPAPAAGARGFAQRGAGARGGSQINVMLNRTGTGRNFAFGAGTARTSVQPDGTFQISGVVPGPYTLVAVSRQDNQQYSARLKVDVGDADVNNVSIPLRAGLAISGKIFLDGTPPPQFKMSQLRVNLVVADDFPGIGNNGGNSQVADDGSFTLPNVSPMEYRVRVSGLPQGGYLMAGRVGSSDAVNEPFVIAGDQQVQMQLQVGFSAGHVQGTVVDRQGNVFAGALATLVPDDPRRLRIELYFSSPTDQSGRFTFSNVPPGGYKLFAWEDIPSGAYQDPEFIRPYEDRGRPVKLDAAGSVDANATVISLRQ